MCNSVPNRKVILVDDEAYVTTTIAAKFRQRGYEVVTAGNGDDAFSAAVALPPDLIITDYQMPLMSGYDMSVKLKELPATANVPLIMLTARGHHLSQEQLAKTNIRLVLAKPFSIRELMSRADEVLGTLAKSGATP